MKKLFLYAFFIFLSLSALSQEEVLMFKNILKDNDLLLKQMYSIVNEENRTISLFFIDNEHIYSYLINEEYKVMDSIKIKNKNTFVNVFFGHSISSSNEYCIYLSNSSLSKLATIHFSFENKRILHNEFKFNPKKEKIIHAVSHKNKFYILTSTKNTSIINKYLFDHNANYTKHEIDFGEMSFRNKNRKKTKLYWLFKISETESVRIVNTSLPNPLDITSAHNKLYIDNDGQVNITFDHNNAFIQLISFNLESAEKEVKYIKKPLVANSKTFYARSNSYIYDNKVFMIAATDETLKFSIKDLHTDKLIKEYSVTKDDSIHFKNTAFLNMKKNKKNQNTKEFLEKIAYNALGVSAYKIDGNYQIALGGSAYSTDSGAAYIMGASFGLIGILAYHVIDSATSHDDIYTYSTSAYFKSVFDNKFEHKIKEVRKNAIEKFAVFKKENNIGVSKGQAIFKHKKSLIYAYYNNKTKKIKLWKFDD